MADIKTPPHNEDAEVSVLGAILLDREAIVQIADKLEAECFYLRAHGDIYEAMLKLFDEREPIDVVTLTNQLKKMKRLSEVGGTAYVTKLAASVPTSAHVVQYAKIVRDLWVKRSLITLAGELSELAFDPSKETAFILDKTEKNVFGLSQQSMKKSFVSIKKALAESFDRLDELHKNSDGLRGVSTGFLDLDNTLAGMQKSNLLILAARPGVGKTAFSLSIAQHAAVVKKMKVGYFALEMSTEEMVDRLLVQVADIDAWRLKTGRLSEDDFEKLSEAMGVLAEAPLYFDDTPGQSVLEVRTKARRLMAEHGLDLIVVDYLQLMQGTTKDNRVQEVSEISQGLKNLARELKVPVLALSQLNRSVESRGTKQPQLSDLRESGCLTGDTLITRADTGERVAIQSLVGQKDIPVFSYDATEKKLIPALMAKAFSSGKKMVYELELRSGRTIKASGNHPFMTVDGWKKLEKLDAGEHVATPRILDLNVTPSEEKTMNQYELMLLGHLLGDGCFVKRQPIHYTNTELELHAYVSECAERLFGIQSRLVKQENWYHLYLPSPYRLTHGKRNPIAQWLDDRFGIFGLHSREKYIPGLLFQQSDTSIALFLAHLWSTDGCVHVAKSDVKGPKVSIYFASGSERMVRDVSSLLLRLGIFSTIRTSKKTGYKDMWTVWIQGKEMQLKFIDTVGSVGAKARRAKVARALLEKVKQNPNLDVLPKKLWKHIEKIWQEQSYTTRSFHAAMGWSYSGTQRMGNGIGRERLAKIAEVLHDNELLSHAQSDAYWDEVVSIKKMGIQEVFDATIPGVENFVANDIIVHNSIEQDSDVVMFLYREEDEAPERVKLSIAKHRNGPLRLIDLFFKGDRIKFYGMEQR